MRSKEKILCTLLCIILTAALWSSSALPAAPKRILLIIMDGARYDYCTPETMPNLFSFMKKALVFTNAYAPSSWTLPSHASLFTGLYPQQHGVFKLPYQPTNDIDTDTKRRLEVPLEIDNIAVPDEAVTIADVLRAAGYQTLGVFGNPCYGYPIFNLNKGFETWVNPVEDKLKVTGVMQRGFYSFDYEVDGKFYTVIPNASEVARTVAALLESADPARPMFLFINFEDPIATTYYYPPEERGEVFKNYNQYLNKSMTKIDDVLPPILSFFKEGLIIVTSDHGQGDGKNFRVGEHATSLFTDQTKIPLFIHNGASIPLNPAAPIDLTHIRDIILKTAGLAYPGAKTFFSPDEPAAFGHLDASSQVPAGMNPSFSIFSNRSLLIISLSSGGFVKYCYTRRPAEQSIVELMQIEDDLSRKIAPFMGLERIFPLTGKCQTLDENNLEMLKGLGYIE